MDSGNSGSLQSSSGGDEEYDSRAAANSVFMTSHQPPPLFDPFSNFIHQNNNSSLIHPNMAWPRPGTSLRSDPNFTPRHNNITNLNPMLSASPPFIPSFQRPSSTAVGDHQDKINTGVAPTTAENPNHAAARNPRKRSRASRRAPTTVLTTDTSNFRAMVQEFTGIPAPPFNNNTSSFTRNLFATRSAAALEAPPYLRHHFPQKANSPPPQFLASTALDHRGANNNISSVSSTISSSSIISQSSNLFSNPLLFTSLLQTNPKFWLPSSSVMASKPHYQGSFEIPSNDSGFDEFGLGRGHGNDVASTINGLPNLVSSDQVAARNANNEGDDDNADGGDDYRARMKRVNGDYNEIKMNYAASSSSDFRGEKGPPENVALRGEGMVESWICSSD